MFVELVVFCWNVFSIRVTWCHDGLHILPQLPPAAIFQGRCFEWLTAINARMTWRELFIGTSLDFDPLAKTFHLQYGKERQQEHFQSTLAVLARGDDWFPSQFIHASSAGVARGSHISSEHGSVWRSWTRTSGFQELASSR